MKGKRRRIFSYLSVIGVAILLAFNFHIFIITNDFAPAGLNGIATMIQYKTGFSISYMSLLINIPLCIFAYFFVERKFATQTLIFSLVYSVVYIILQNSGLDSIQYNAKGHDTIYPVIISGVISGAVNGICFKSGACTGGTDIVSRYINIVKRKTNFFIVTFILNAIVATLSLFVYSDNTLDYKPVALCITYCFILSFVGNQIIKGTKTAYQFTIITTYPDDIAEEISSELQHSATKINATGVYTNTEKSVLLCVVNKHQLTDVQEILSKYDDTFSFYGLINETYGNFVYVK